MYGANIATIPTGVDGNAVLDRMRRRVHGAEGPSPGSAEASEAYLVSDHMLVRFLIARQWDIEKAMTMLKEHYRWMSDIKMAALLTDPFPEEPVIKRYYPQAYHGTDKQGRPLYIERPGLIDMPRLLQATTAKRLLEYIYTGSELQIRRRLPACSVAVGKVVDKSLNILDLEGLGFSVVTHTTARKVLKDVVQTIQNHYPEQMGRLIIINAPKVFGLAWSFVQPMLDEKTRAKISIYGTNKDAYSAALLELVDAEQLPKLFGGNCVCDGKDPNSCMLSVKGPWVQPDICTILDTQPLVRLMTPEGAAEAAAQLRRHQEVGSSVPDGITIAADAPPGSSVGVDDVASDGDVPTDGSTVAADTKTAAAADATVQASSAPALRPEGDSVGPSVTTPTSDDVDMVTPLTASRSLAVSNPEMSHALADVERLVQEYAAHEEVHMRTLTNWVQEFNSLVEEIGRHIIERAQGYYDSMTLWQQAVQEYAKTQEEVAAVGKELEQAVRNLSRAEAAFEAFVDGTSDLSEEEWEAFAPLAVADTAAAAGDPKLLRTLRVSVVANAVACLQLRRDATHSEAQAKHRELDEARRRFEFEQSQHSRCTWNCSIKRAAPFYEKRRMHESTVESQLSVLRSVEQLIQQARQKAARLQHKCHQDGSSPGNSIREYSFDQMSLHSFEIAGGEPAQDEFLSCDGSASEGEDR